LATARIQHFGNVFRNRNRGADFIERTRSMTDSTIAALRTVAEDPIASEYINRIIDNKNNVCLGSLEEAIEGIENTTALVENAGDELKALMNEANKLTNINGTSEAVREVASILRMLGPLIYKLTPETFCQASPDQALASLEDLTIMLYEMADLRDLGLRSNVRSTLRKSASTMSSINTFFIYIRLTFEKFDQMCSLEKQYNIEAIYALGDMLGHMADLFRSTGGFDMADRIRKGKLFAYRLAIKLRKIDLYDLGFLDCSEDLSYAADALDDLANLVDEFGLESLQEDLGVDFSDLFN